MMNQLIDRKIEDEKHPTAPEIHSWWEKRRKQYNIVVGSAGVLVIMLYFILVPNVLVDVVSELIVTVVGAVVYGIAANICFFAGPISERFITWLFNGGKTIPNLAPALYYIGLAGSVLLTLAIGLLNIYIALMPVYWD